MPTVGMVNWFFAHYRSPVVHELEKANGFRFTWVSDSKDSSGGGIPTMDMSQMGSWIETTTIRLLGGVRWQRGVLRYALSSDDQVIIYTGDVRFASTWLAALATRIRGGRVLFWTHGWTSPDKGVKKYLRRWFYRTAHGLLLYSEHARRIGLAAGFDADSLYVIGNSMGSPIVWRGSGDRLAERGQSWVVISRLIADRKIAEVITQAARLTSEGRPVSLTIVGDGPERQRLAELCRQLEFGVAFIGANYDPESTATILGEADICLSPGHIGLAAVHALSCGCPVATHGDADRQMPEFEAIDHGVTGVLFPYGDYRAMAESAWSFVAAHERSEVANRCHTEITRRWTPEQHAARIEAAIIDQMGRLSGESVSIDA